MMRLLHPFICRVHVSLLSLVDLQSIQVLLSLHHMPIAPTGNIQSVLENSAVSAKPLKYLVQEDLLQVALIFAAPPSLRNSIALAPFLASASAS
jgi:hypothetical protein